MLRKFVLAFSRNSLVLIILIVAVAAILSIISYQFSRHNANEILIIASDDIRSNANIPSHDLSTIVEQELDNVTGILKTLSSAPAINNNEMQYGSANKHNLSLDWPMEDHL